MSWQVLCSDITIGSFRWAGVNEVRVVRSLHSYGDRAIIKVPSICKVVQGRTASTEVLVTANQFNEGDSVTINLGYNDSYLNYAGRNGGPTPVIGTGEAGAAAVTGGMRTVFRGFVKRVNLGMPLEIECEGYVRCLRLGLNVTANYKSTTAGTLLKLVEGAKCVGGNLDGQNAGIKVVVADDIELINVRVPNNNGVEIVDAVKRLSQGTLNVFFINPTTLWCGLVYTPVRSGKDPWGLGTANYRLGWNVMKDNSLKMRTPVERVQVLFGGTFATGEKVMTASDDKTAQQKMKAVFNHVGNTGDMKVMAQEKQEELNYEGYEGSINAFLQPWCAPGWIVNIVDDRYKKRNGRYIVEGTEVQYGLRGARIRVEVGVRVG
jgi:hypothetical protein